MPCVYVEKEGGGGTPVDPQGTCTDGNAPLSYEKVRGAMCAAGSTAAVCKQR